MTDTPITPEPTLVQKIGAEVLGTFVLVFIGVGAAINLDGIGVTGVALAFGIAVLVMAYAVGHISGGHFNPAVSVGAAFAGRLSWVNAGIYAAAQLVGAVVAAAALFLVYKSIDGWDAEGAMGQNAFGDEAASDIALWGALIVEIIGTAIFLYVILAATDRRNPSAAAAPIAIGLALAGVHLALIPLTGTSVNPARSIAPALFAGTDSLMQVWLFIVAPLIGAAIAGLTYALIFGSDGEPVPGSGLNFGGNAQATAFAGGWDPNAQHQGGQFQGGYDPQAQQWGQPEQQWGGQAAPAQQQWGQQAPEQQQWGQPAQDQWGQPAPEQQWGQPQTDQQQWGQPQTDQQQWGQPQTDQQQWGEQQAQQGGQHAAPQQPEQQWGQPDQAPEPWTPPEDDGSRTQIRPSDDTPS
ncbi:MIP family channel protein [Nocardioides sp. JQ2195]|uniref:MIP/aquaporin family protein n=1 Tax=Nocardioides sp. JQ2195 TaxID=2592334 RepID=UPI00143EACDD|nr:MIP family channel protein [Nocardioides sp. JQ2195]QIX25861.1 MIP family channel protein [Nocardioides sp. JQ2195]